MRKRLLNQLNLTRKQRWFLVLFALVLLPMGTWGQTSYGICIGHYEGGSLVGVRVTSENATNISGDGITGTVTFDNDSRTLTLNGATINGCIYSFGNITINIVGSNYIAATDTCAAIRCTASAATVGTLIFTSTDDTGKLTMRGNYNPCTEGFSSPTYENSLSVLIHESNDSDLPSQNNFIVIGTQLFSGGNGESTTTPYLIGSVADLKDLATYINAPYLDSTGKFFQLSNDIDCTNETDFTPIGRGFEKEFKGTFDGNSKTISNLVCESGLFQEVGDNTNQGIVKNLILENGDFTTLGATGGIAAVLNSGKIQNCSVVNTKITSNAQSPRAGGIVGRLMGGEISGCTVSGSNTEIIGLLYDPTSENQNGDSSAGGIVGETYPYYNDIVITECEVSGVGLIQSSHNVPNGKISAGGIVGNTSSEGGHATSITSNTVTGSTTIKSEDSRTTGDPGNAVAGAIFGYASSETLTGNTYASTVTTGTKDAGAEAYNTLSGQTERGIGQYYVEETETNYPNYDEIGKVELAGTKKIAITPSLLGGEFMPKDGTYYMSVDNVSNNTYDVYALPETAVTIKATPNEGYKPVLELSDNTIAVTADEIEEDEIYNHTEFTFTMPDANLTATLAFPINLSADGITATIDDVDYTGSAIEPTTVKVEGISGAAGITELTNGTDFTISSYSLNGASVDSPVNAGTYKVTIEGQGNYIGIIENIDYTIAKIDIAKCERSDNIETESYKGSKYEPTFEVTSETSTLTLNTDYTVAYYKVENGVVGDTPVDMIEVGNYKIVISGIGNYSGTKSYDFEIYKADLNIVTIEAIADQTYKGSEIEPEIKVTLNDVTLNPDDYGYTVRYSNNTNVSASGTTSVPTVTLTALATSECFTEGTTKIATFVIIPKSIEGVTVTLSGDGFDSVKNCFVYNGQDQKPTVTVKDGDKLLVLDTDYTLDNTGGFGAEDNYDVTVWGKGNYDENTRVVATYGIAPRSIAETNVNLDATVTYVYTGGEHEPEPVVKYGDTELTLNTDYTVSYSNNINAAASTAENAPTVIITGKGNFDENTTTKVKFTIGQADLATAAISKISFGGTDYTVGDAAIEIPYTGEAIHPTVKEVKYNDGTVTLDASEYTVSWGANNTELSGESESDWAEVIITSTGKNFTAGTSTSLKFKIVAANVTITADDQTETYNGSAQAYTSAKVSNENVTLAIAYYATEDDRTKGSNALTGAPTDAGTYYIKVTQTNSNYTAEPANATFTIEQFDISSAVITLSNKELTYTGEEQTVSVTKVMVGELEVPNDCYLVYDCTGTEAGTYTLTVTAIPNGDAFKNNFTGYATTTFTIKDRTAEINFGSGLTYMTYYKADEDCLIPDGVSAYIITGVGEMTVTVKKVSYLKADTPLLLEKTSGSTIEKDPDESFDGNKLVYADADVATTGNEFVLYKNEFVKATGTITQGKCYLNLAGAAPSRGMYGIDNDGSTVIDNIQSDNLQSDNWYDLQGCRIQKPMKAGLYIKNGKKVVVNNK